MNFKDIFFKENRDVKQEIPKENVQTRDYLSEKLQEAFPNMGFQVGGSVSERGALTLSAFFSAVEIISNSIASLPILIKSQSKDVEKEMYFKDLLKNQHLSEYMFKKQLIQDILLHGDGFVYIDRKRKKINSLRYIPYYDMNVYFNKTTGVIDYKCSYLGILKASDVIHIYKLSDDEGYRGLGIIKYAQRTVDLANYTETAASDYYKQGLNWTGIVSSKTPLNQVQAKQAMASVTSAVNPQNGGGYVKFLPFDSTFQPLTQTAKDATLIDTRTFNIAEIARYFNISPTLLQDLSHGNFNSFEMQSLSFLTQTLLPYIKVIEDEFTRKLFPDNDYYVDIDEREYVRMQSKDASEYYSKLVSSGIISVNEARKNLGYEAVENGDNLIIAYTDISQNKINDDKSDSEEKEDKEDGQQNNTNKEEKQEKSDDEDK